MGNVIVVILKFILVLVGLYNLGSVVLVGSLF